MLLSLALGQHATLAPSHTQVYNNEEHGFAVEFPGSWRVEPGVLTGTLVKSLWRSGRDTATILVSVNSDKAGVATMSPSEFALQFAAKVPGEMNGYGMDTTVHRHALWIDVTIPTTPPRRALYYMIPHQGKVLLLTCTAHPRFFESHQTEFYATARSVRFGAFAQAVREAVAEPFAFTDSSLGLSLTLPESWSVLPSDSPRVMYAQGGLHEGATQKPCIEVLVEDNPGDLTLNDLRDLADTVVAAQISSGSWWSNPAVTAKEVKTVAGQSALFTDFTATSTAPTPRPVSIRCAGYFFVRPERIIVVRIFTDPTDGRGYEEAMTVLASLGLSAPPGVGPVGRRSISGTWVWLVLLAAAAVYALAAILLKRRSRSGLSE
jgi:hypothetical protein